MDNITSSTQQDEPMGEPSVRNNISDKELNECDREDLSHIGLVQGGCGHVLFVSNPEGEIIGHDDDVCQLEFIQPQMMRMDGDDKPTLIGTQLKDCIPAPVYAAIIECVNQMILAMSHRTFHFYSVPGKTFSLSISSTEDDYSVVGIEIEVSKDSQAVRTRVLILKRRHPES